MVGIKAASPRAASCPSVHYRVLAAATYGIQQPYTYKYANVFTYIGHWVTCSWASCATCKLPWLPWLPGLGTIVTAGLQFVCPRRRLPQFGFWQCSDYVRLALLISEVNVAHTSVSFGLVHADWITYVNIFEVGCRAKSKGNYSKEVMMKSSEDESETVRWNHFLAERGLIWGRCDEEKKKQYLRRPWSHLGSQHFWSQTDLPVTPRY